MAALVDVDKITSSSGAPFIGAVSGPVAPPAFETRVSAAMSELISAVSSTLGSTASESAALATIPTVLGEKLSAPDLLTAAQQKFDEEKYARHLIHADPLGRFSILALAWLPGQFTPVHGHNAWGVIGVHDGTMENICYAVASSKVSSFLDPSRQTSGQVSAPYHPVRTQRAEAGRIVSVPTGDSGAHRLRNPGPETAFTVHIYGMDLAAEPMGINRYYD